MLRSRRGRHRGPVQRRAPAWAPSWVARPTRCVRIGRSAYEDLVATAHDGQCLTSELAKSRRESEQTITGLRAAVAAADRRAAAEHLVNVRTFDIDDVTFTPLERIGLVLNLPTRADGGLDEAAFLDIVDRHMWERRLDQLDVVAGA